MKFTNLEDLINYMMHDIMTEEYEQYLKIDFGEQQILMFVFEAEIPIVIRRQTVFVGNKPEQRILAEVFAELLRTDIGTGWLSDLDKICQLIQDNDYIFDKLLKKENKNDKSSI